MSRTNDEKGRGKPRNSDEWIERNQPTNGLFKVYWKDVIADNDGGVTLNPDEGEGLRWEWYYKDGKHANGISKGWWPNGNLKHTKTWKDGISNGLSIFWFKTGQKKYEETFKDGIFDGERTYWYENGEKWFEESYKDGERDGLQIEWYENGQKKYEETYKSGKRIGLWTDWDENGKKRSEEP